MPLLILSGLIQLALIVHVMKTGRDTFWIYVIFSGTRDWPRRLHHCRAWPRADEFASQPPQDQTRTGP